ncbi:MAG: hypothetical protein WD824_13540 [Cyclobacteriaceae bacterium]
MDADYFFSDNAWHKGTGHHHVFGGDLNKCGFSLRSFFKAFASRGIISFSISSIRSAANLFTGKLLSPKQRRRFILMLSEPGNYFLFFWASAASFILRKACSWLKDLDFFKSSRITFLESFPLSNGSDGNCFTDGFIRYKDAENHNVKPNLYNSIHQFDLHLLLVPAKSAAYRHIFLMQLIEFAFYCYNHIESSKRTLGGTCQSPSTLTYYSDARSKFLKWIFHPDHRQVLKEICLFRTPYTFKKTSRGVSDWPKIQELVRLMQILTMSNYIFQFHSLDTQQQ